MMRYRPRTLLIVRALGQAAGRVEAGLIAR